MNNDLHPATPDIVSNFEIAKQRNGPAGTVKLNFFKNWTRFESLSKVDQRDSE
jgi:replicative DNA helicase